MCTFISSVYGGKVHIAFSLLIDHFKYVVQKHYLCANIVQPSQIFISMVFSYYKNKAVYPSNLFASPPSAHNCHSILGSVMLTTLKYLFMESCSICFFMIRLINGIMQYLFLCNYINIMPSGFIQDSCSSEVEEYSNVSVCYGVLDLSCSKGHLNIII